MLRWFQGRRVLGKEGKARKDEDEDEDGRLLYLL